MADLHAALSAVTLGYLRVPGVFRG